jgi:predicted deacylase
VIATAFPRSDERTVMSERIDPGIHRRVLAFDAPALLDCNWQVVDVVGADPGPRLAVMAGMHINEVSSIEATLQLPSHLDPANMKGSISIISVVNWPAWETRDRLVCPIDKKNINFCSPGRPDGTFSEALAHALVSVWAADAVCLVDLHGADLCEQVARFAVYQSVGDPRFDAEAQKIAAQFDVDLIVALGDEHMRSPGRSVTGRALMRQHGAFVEAGEGAVIGEEEVKLHRDGVLRLAEYYGILPKGSAPVSGARNVRILHEYHWIASPWRGWCTMHIKAGNDVAQGTRLATLVDLETGVGHDLLSEFDGVVLWRDTSPVVSAGQIIAGVGR